MWEKITRPTLVIDKKKCIRNIRRIKAKADQFNCTFRPHFKTHQHAEVGSWFKDEGIEQITVSSVEMAEYFADHGWSDITIAFPVNLLEIPKIEKLAQQIQLNLIIENKEGLEAIKHLYSVGIWIKVDTGYGRTGVDIGSLGVWEFGIKRIEILIDFIEKYSLKFCGFLSHFGHTYKAESQKEIIDIYKTNKDLLINLRNSQTPKLLNSQTPKLLNSQTPSLQLSIGDTPSISLTNDLAGIDEIRPGNFIYYDMMQYYLGSCDLDDIAAMVACPVVAKHNDRNELIIYGGGVHFSKDTIKHVSSCNFYGNVVSLSSDPAKDFNHNNYLRSVSQEHGIVRCTPDFFNQHSVGDLVGVMPIHSCLAANLLKEHTLIKSG